MPLIRIDAPVDFSEKAYMEAYPDVVELAKQRPDMSGWAHYFLYGWKEGRWAGLRNVINPFTGLRAPPPHLRYRVRMQLDVFNFCSSGDAEARTITNIISESGCLKDGARVLDFGCGCGSITGSMGKLNPQLLVYGSDIDEEAIRWCRQHLHPVARFWANEPFPPLQVEDNFFDFIYGVSVFTHLPEDMQFAWLAEFRRVLRPNGYLWATFHGENHLRRPHYAHLRDEFEQKGFVHDTSSATPGLPSFYQTTFHNPKYIESEWSRYLEIVALRTEAFGGGDFAHGTVLVRKRV